MFPTFLSFNPHHTHCLAITGQRRHLYDHHHHHPCWVVGIISFFFSRHHPPSPYNPHAKHDNSFFWPKSITATVATILWASPCRDSVTLLQVAPSDPQHRGAVVFVCPSLSYFPPFLFLRLCSPTNRPVYIRVPQVSPGHCQSTRWQWQPSSAGRCRCTGGGGGHVECTPHLCRHHALVGTLLLLFAVYNFLGRSPRTPPTPCAVVDATCFVLPREFDTTCDRG